MRIKILVLFLLTMPSILFSQTVEKEKSIYDFDLKVNHLVREQFFTVAINHPIYDNFTMEAEYGYWNYHRAALSIGYKFKQLSYTPYLSTGMFFIKEFFDKVANYSEYGIKLGLGLETNLTDNLFFNVEGLILNYVSTNYKLRKIKYRKEYDFGESLDYTFSIGIGYRFHF